jgi:hypothetical protein
MTNCMAFGPGSKSKHVIDRWNGTSWQSLQSAAISAATVASISCALALERHLLAVHHAQRRPARREVERIVLVGQLRHH